MASPQLHVHYPTTAPHPQPELHGPLETQLPTPPPLNPDSLTLVSALPSPYSRKIRIYLHERQIPYQIYNFSLSSPPSLEKDSIGYYSPFGKVPILLTPTNPPLMESKLIAEWLEEEYAGEGLIPKAREERWKANRIQAIADGGSDAIALVYAEIKIGNAARSERWGARQKLKIKGVMKAIGDLVRELGEGAGTSRFLVGDRFSIADIAVGCFLVTMVVADRDFGAIKWMDESPELVGYWKGLEGRESFRRTMLVTDELGVKNPNK